MITHDQIAAAHRDATNLEMSYLREHGWVQTCNTPGAYWIWVRDFHAEDAARHARWKESGPGPLGWPSEPRPFGRITAPTEIAVKMTASFLETPRPVLC